MYIEFRLPSGAGGVAAGYASSRIRRAIEAWTAKYNISYRTKVVKYTLRLCLERDEDYAFFQLSWDPDFEWAKNYSVVYPDGYGRS